MDKLIKEKAYFLFDEQKICGKQRYSRIYIGNEFCDRRVPSLDSLKKIIDWCSDMFCELTLVTSCMTNEGLG